MQKPILTIFYQFNPWDTTIGGIQTVISLFIKYAPNDFEVRLVGTGNGCTQPRGTWQEAEFAGREIRFLPLLTLQNDNVRSRIPTTLKYTAALLGRCFASDFMHFHRLEPTLAALPWSGDKTLFIHNDIYKQMKSEGNQNAILWRRFPAVYFAMERLLAKQFSQILSCNTESVKLYQQRYPALADRVSYIRNIVDNEIFYPLALEERAMGRCQLAKRLGLKEETNFVLFAGRLHPQKDPILLVRSIAALNEPNIHLLIAGAGELEGEVCSEIAQIGLSKQVTMLGPVHQAQLAELHQICSAFVLTSAYEGLPLVALEALACGTPVVTTRCGETPNLLSDRTGVVCEERAPVAIADALRKVLLHPENYPMQACVQTAQPYSACTVVSDVYKDMRHRWEQRTLSVVPS
ncbi:MAG: glycosyltransferase family 4 protein [Symplocastrum torsivum CPER-KK1]|jgi:glycosyltransferase involved in cell wall biosynthesis|uniref:Glycosyltransferase family 4 protein n=1 Tax=Symplocastrum torsivum CPER-KK1 TaxID=450513 RepID=A0A951PPM5_9CYAN|nr:glycosyltransferase family 4 protein [Symplocastrum torsivum CPER-KK1]